MVPQMGRETGRGTYPHGERELLGPPAQGHLLSLQPPALTEEDLPLNTMLWETGHMAVS